VIDKLGYSCPASLEFNRDYDLGRSVMAEDTKKEKGPISLLAEQQIENEIKKVQGEYPSNIPERTVEVVAVFLTVAYFQRAGLLSRDFWPHNLDVSSRSSILLAEMCVDLGWAPPGSKGKIDEGVLQAITQAQAEVDFFYSIIKSVGIKGVNDRERKWEQAVLKRYDDSLNGFQYIKRSYLEDAALYGVDDTNPKRDFQSKLLQKIINGEGFGEIRKDILYELKQKDEKIKTRL
jgi:hypothetical protein